MRRSWNCVLVVVLILAALGDQVVATPDALGLSRVPEGAAANTNQSSTSQDNLPPLPRGCIAGGTGAAPTSAPNGLCCISGYVFVDGKAVADAEVTITAQNGSVLKWTGEGPDSEQPYYHASLSDAPLGVAIGTAIVITATYGSWTNTITHTVKAGGQQVDIVITPPAASHYGFKRQLFQTPIEPNSSIMQLFPQAAGGRFNFYKPDIAIDATDTVYVSDWVNGRIQVFNSRGTFVRQWGTQGDRPEQFRGPASIAVDGMGNVYVAEIGNHRVQKFSTNGTFVKSWDGSGTPQGRFHYPAGIAVDRDGNVYVADTVNNLVRTFDSDGKPKQSWAVSGANMPYSIAVHPNGRVYVASVANNRVLSFAQPQPGTGATQTITEVASLSEPFNFLVDGASDAGVFKYSAGLTIDAAGSIYVVDSGANRVRRFGADGKEQTWQPADQSAFNRPAGIEVDSSGMVYVADAYNHVVRAFKNATKSTAETNGNLAYERTLGGLGVIAQGLNNPTGMVVDKSGFLFVADTASNRILRFDASGTLRNQWSSVTAGGVTTGFNRPTGLAISNDRLLISDSGSNKVLQRSITPTVELTTTTTFIDGNWFNDTDTRLRFRTDDNAGNIATDFTGGLTVAPSGDVFVANTHGKTIMQFDSNGTWRKDWKLPNSTIPFTPTDVAMMDDTVLITDLASNHIKSIVPGGTSITDWLTDTAAFKEPTGIEVDAQHRVYVTDSEHTRVRVFNQNKQEIETIGGEPGSGPGVFIEPQGIAISRDGQLYVSDHDLNRVQMFERLQKTKPNATFVAVHDQTSDAPVSVDVMGASSQHDSRIVGFTLKVTGKDGTTTYTNNAPTPMNDSGQTASATFSIPTDTLKTGAQGSNAVTLVVHDEHGTSDPQHTVIVVPSTESTKTWTFMLYLAGDNSDIAPYLDDKTETGALYRLIHQQNPSTRVNVVALYDGPKGGFSRPSTSDSARFTMMRKQTNDQTMPAPVTEQLVEKNMGNPQTLIDFVRDAKQRAPADYYYLAIADHANGLDGMAWDKNESDAERLTNAEIRQALLTITDSGANPIDVLHFDGCLMGQIENAYQVRGLAKYLVASQNLGWSTFAYDDYRSEIEHKASATSPQDFVKIIVDQYAYNVRDYPHTIAAYDLSVVDQAVRLTNEFAKGLLQLVLDNPDNRQRLLALRNGTAQNPQGVQKFDSNQNYRITKEDVFVDLTEWADVTRVLSSTLATTHTKLMATLDDMVVENERDKGVFAGSEMDVQRAKGISIYFPPRLSKKTFASYVQGDLEGFSDATAWDEFLSAVLAGESFDTSEPVAVDNEPLAVVAPTLDAISPREATAGDATATITLTGTNFLQTSRVLATLDDGTAKELPSRYESKTKLVAFIETADLRQARPITLTVETTGPGGGTTDPQTFTVKPQQPTISAFSPPVAIVGDSDFTLTIIGDNFSDDSGVLVNGVARASNLVDRAHLQTMISATDVLRLGSVRVDVVTPGAAATTMPLRVVPASWSNNVQNPGFDIEGAQPTVPSDWTVRGAERITAPSRNGTPILKFPNTNGQTATVTQTISTVKPYMQYTLSTMLSIPTASGTVSGTMRLDWKRVDGSTIKSVIAPFGKQGQDWMRFYRDIDAPKDTASATLSFLVWSSKPAVYLDDVSLIPFNILANGTFEAPLTASGTAVGWTADSHVTINSVEVSPGVMSMMMRHQAVDDASYTISQELDQISSEMPLEIGCLVRIPKVNPSVFDAKVPDQFLFQLEVQWRDNKGTVLGTTPIRTFIQKLDSFTEARITTRAPERTVSASLRMVVASLNGTINVDQCSARIGSLLRDNSFEGSKPVSSTISTWTANPLVTRSPKAAKTGMYGMALKMPPNASNGLGTSYTITTTSTMPVLAGTAYKFVTPLMITGTNEFRFSTYVDWLDKDGKLITTMRTWVYTKALTSWKENVSILTAPQGAKAARLRFEVYAKDATSSSVIVVDDIEFRP